MRHRSYRGLPGGDLLPLCGSGPFQGGEAGRRGAGPPGLPGLGGSCCIVVVGDCQDSSAAGLAGRINFFTGSRGSVGGRLSLNDSRTAVGERLFVKG